MRPYKPSPKPRVDHPPLYTLPLPFCTISIPAIRIFKVLASALRAALRDPET